MKTKIVVTAVMIALGLSLRVVARPQSDWAMSGTNPVPEGATVRVVFDKEQFLLGEDVIVHFVLENTGTTPFSYSTGGDYRGASRALRFIVTATDEAGVQAEDPDPERMCFGGLCGPAELKPGEKKEFNLALMRYCDIAKPGRYTIRVTHDFGWSDKGGPLPAGEAVVAFTLPSATEAEQLVAQLERMSPGETDFGCLRQEAYLDPLLRRARAGSGDALRGIASIPTLAATVALIELAGNTNADLALSAGLTLNCRLPDPEFTGQLPGRGPFRFDAKEARRRLASRSWDEKFAPDVRALAARFLAGTLTNSIGCGAFMVQAVGTPGEAPAVLSALDRVLEPMVNPRRTPGDNILNDPEPLPELRRALQSLASRGFALGKNLSGQAQFFAYFAALENSPPPRPPEWLNLLEVFGDNCRYPTREAAVRSIPQPVPPECLAFITKRLSDPDLGVCRAACEKAGQSGHAEYLKPLLEIVSTENHEWLLREAGNAAHALGGGFDFLTAWADRLGDEHLYPLALDYLGQIVEGLPGGHSGRTDLSRAERLALKTAWNEFLAAHADELRKGNRFNVDDPALKPALFGRARSWTLPSGRVWPAAGGV